MFVFPVGMFSDEKTENGGTTKFLSHFNGTNGSTNFVDVKGNTIGISGTPIISTTNSKFDGSSLYLNGDNAALNINRNDIDLRSSVSPIWTIECWINQLTQDGRRWIFVNYNLNGGAQSNTLLLGNNRIGTDISFVEYTLPQNQWVHWAVTRNDNGLMSLYLNGILTASIEANPSESAEFNYIGGSPGDNNIGQEFIKAYIDEFRIKLGEVLYTTNFTPPTSPFNDNE